MANAKSKKTVVIVLLMIFVLLFEATQVSAATPFSNLIARSAILAEADSGAVLYSFNMRSSHPADALSKAMTLLQAVIACENGTLRDEMVLTMTESAWEDVDSANASQNIRPGEEMTVRDLMYCAFVGGDYTAANLLAERIAGSVFRFVEMMNSHAAELGCENTNFVNPYGRYHVNQYTTAIDQFNIYRGAMTHSLFAEISGTYRYTTESTNAAESRRLTSTNSLLNANGKYYLSTCLSGVTSATYEGGYSMVAYGESDGLSLIAVILGSDDIILEDESSLLRNLSETRRLLDWGFTEFGWRTILSSGELIAKAAVAKGDGSDFVNLRPESSITLLLDKDISLEDFTKNITIYSVRDDEELSAPVTAGDILGEVTLSRNGVEYGPILLLANTDVELHRLESMKLQISAVLTSGTAKVIIAILFLLLAGYIALVVRYHVLRSKRKRRIKAVKEKLIADRKQSGGED